MQSEHIRTQIVRVDSELPEAEAIRRAADVLRAGGLVAFPTETVYGLGANALDAAAVARIFAAKGRPANNPVIVHVANMNAVREIVTVWPETAVRLAERFWPGPLTLVLPRNDRIPALVTAGGPTVAMRIPSHPVALALLRAAALPIAAPSANRSTRLSPTRAEHVARDLQGCIEMILDGGPTTGGLESTVLDLTHTPPRLLRPGLIAPVEIEAILGPIVRTPAQSASDTPLPSPGMLARHYAPRAPLVLAAGNGQAQVEAWLQQGERVGWLTFAPQPGPAQHGLTTVVMPRDPVAYAARLYAVLHALDEAGVTRLVVALPPDEEVWMAVRDRLRRAAASH